MEQSDRAAIVPTLTSGVPHVRAVGRWLGVFLASLNRGDVGQRAWIGTGAPAIYDFDYANHRPSGSVKPMIRTVYDNVDIDSRR